MAFRNAFIVLLEQSSLVGEMEVIGNYSWFGMMHQADDLHAELPIRHPYFKPFFNSLSGTNNTHEYTSYLH